MDKRILYLDKFVDEVMPDLRDFGGPTPEGWAAWLAPPDESWNRSEGAKTGETFSGHFTTVTDHMISVPGGGWQEEDEDGEGARPFPPNPQPSATWFAIRFGPGLGWDCETCTDSWDGVLEQLSEPEYWAEDAVVACCTDDPPATFEFTMEDGKPTLREIRAG